MCRLAPKQGDVGGGRPGERLQPSRCEVNKADGKEGAGESC